MSNKTYLGDGVYAQWRENDIKLTAENGYTTTDEIILEPEVLEALLMWIELPPT